MGNSSPVWLAKCLGHRNYTVQNDAEKPVEINQATSQKWKCRIPLKGSHVNFIASWLPTILSLVPSKLGRTVSEMKSHALSILTRFPANHTGLSLLQVVFIRVIDWKHMSSICLSWLLFQNPSFWMTNNQFLYTISYSVLQPIYNNPPHRKKKISYPEERTQHSH